MPDGVRLAAKLEGGVVRDHGFRRELARDEKRVYLEVVDARAGRHDRVEPSAYAQQASSIDVAAKQAVDGPRAALAPMPMRREVFLVRKNRVGREEVCGAHACR